jgi:hypothetical protein
MAANAASASFLSLRLYRLSRQLAVVTHVAAAYVGIAVLVTVAFGVLVPSMREQSRLLYDGLLSSLRASEAMADASDTAEPVDDGGLNGGRTAGETAVFGAGSLSRFDNFRVPGISPPQAVALRGYIARKYRIAPDVAGSLIQTTYQSGEESGLDPLLLLAVIAIESRYNPFAESHVGAQGLMQIMTRVHRDKFDGLALGADAAFHPVANIKVGTLVLADCISRRGSVTGGLSCYVGAAGPSDGGYGAKVLAERRRMSLASGIAPGLP